MEDKIKLILKKSRIVPTDKLRVIEIALTHAKTENLRMSEADCYFELGKVHLEAKDVEKALSQFYLAINIFEELTGRRNKKCVLANGMLAKCHVLKGDNEIGVKMLNEIQPNIEAVFGIVSIESAEGLKLAGGVRLSQGHVTKAYKKFISAQEIYTAINPKHKEVDFLIYFS